MVSQRIGLVVKCEMRDCFSPKTLSQAESGEVYGKFTPSPMGSVRVKKVIGGIVSVPLNRKNRRLLARRLGKK